MRTHRSTFLLLICLFVTLIASITIADTQEKALSKEDQKKYDLAFEKALVHYEKAHLLFEEEKLDGVVKELKAIIELEFPAGTETSDAALLQTEMYGFLGEIYLEQKKIEDAVKILKAGIKKAPELSKQAYQLYMTLGHAYKTMKKTDEALAAFETAEKINKELLKKEEAEKKSEE